MTRIGDSELEILPLGLGGNTFGNTTDAAASERVLDAFAAAGGSLIDTADVYSAWVPGNKGGESETVLGDWMHRRGNRASMLIATKVGRHPQFPGLSPENVAAAAEASLRRLRTDYIDQYYAHFDEPDRPMEEIAHSFDSLVRAGKVRSVAASNLPPDRIREWIRVARRDGLAVPVALQPQYSLVSRRGYEQNYAPVARDEGLAVFPYYALASGFLSGKYRTEADLQGAARAGSVKAYLTEDGLAVVRAVETVSRDRGVAMATVALAWVLAQPTITAPLASATSTQQLGEILAATELKLSAEELADLEEASRPFA